MPQGASLRLGFAREGCCFRDAIAFLSFGTQVTGLIGQRGILPAATFLRRVKEVTGGPAWHLVPTIFWFDSSDGFLKLVCFLGVVAAGFVFAGKGWRIALVFCYLLYLSLVHAGQDFMSYQWDMLLLESGFLAIFLGWRPFVISMSRWLLFRLMFLSGVAKLMSGDPTWRNLSALRYHYETQPLPPWTAWFMHQLPASFQTASVLFVLFVELAVPLLIFAPRRLRLFAFGALVVLQILIAATGNYAFFNLLAIVLGVTLLDDGVFPGRWQGRAAGSPARRWPVWVLAPVAVITFAATSVHLAGAVRPSLRPPVPLVRLASWLAPFRSTNGYGLFMVMTTSRPEIVVEGSDDGQTWHAYEFRWKPGDLRRRPRFVAPHQPRLDWQMWFAALSTCEANPWFVNFLARLLEGSPPVLHLLAKNPFPDRPPRYIRAVLYDYRFTDAANRRATGAWWRREEKGLYCPVLSRDMLRSAR